MKLHNKKINFLGDSITEGCCATTPERGFVEVMKRKYALGSARNYGIGGTRIARQRIPSEEPKFDRNFVSRVSEMDADADIVVVFGGTNDHGHGDAPFGSDGDRSVDTFCGACHCLYASLLEKFPNAKIVILTPLHRAEETRADGIHLKDYVNQIKRTAAEFHLPVLDLYEQSAIKANIPAIAGLLTTDGLHPNDRGHEILAAEIGEYLKKLK